MALTVSYMGARGDHMPLGGTADVALNVNQLDPKYMALGSQLNAALPNPFFGNAAAGPSSTQATLTRAQLLRPYPQFLNVSARQVSEGITRYNAGVVELIRRTGGSNWYGGRVSYTYSVLKDNQFGEGNFFSNAGSGLPLNSYSYIEGSPYYNPRADYAYGILDVPHRLVLAPVVEVPFGEGRSWSSSNGLHRLRRGRVDGGGDRHGSERLPDRRAAERQHRHVRRRAAAEPRGRCRSGDGRRLDGPARLGEPRRGDVAQPGGVHDRVRQHVRQRPADHHRRAHAAAAERRSLGVEEHPARRDAVRADPSGGREPAEPRDDERHRDDRRQRLVRTDFKPVRVHAADAVLVPVFVLRARRCPRALHRRDAEVAEAYRFLGALGVLCGERLLAPSRRKDIFESIDQTIRICSEDKMPQKSADFIIAAMPASRAATSPG